MPGEYYSGVPRLRTAPVQINSIVYNQVSDTDHDTQYVVLIVFARAKKYARNSVVYSFYWEKERKNSIYGYITPWIEGGTFLQFV